MESNDKNILDKQLKEKLYDQEVSPPDFLWDKIENELDEPKSHKSPFFLLKFFSIVGVVSSIALLYGVLNNTDKSADKLVLKSNLSKNEQSNLTHESNKEDELKTNHSKDNLEKKEIVTNSTTEKESINSELNEEDKVLKNDNQTENKSEKKKVLINQIKTNSHKSNSLAQKDIKSNIESDAKLNLLKSTTQNNNAFVVDKKTNKNNNSKHKSIAISNNKSTQTKSGNTKLENNDLTKESNLIAPKLKNDDVIKQKENISSLNIQNKVLAKELNLENKISSDLPIKSNIEEKDNLSLENKNGTSNLSNENNTLNKEIVLDKLADKNIGQQEQKNNNNTVINDVTIKDSTIVKSNDSLDTKSKVELIKKKSLFNLSSQGITIGALFYPNGAGLNYDYSGSTPSLSKKISVSSKSFMVNLLYKLGITPSWSFNTGINYQHYSIDALQTNTSEKIVLDSVQKFKQIKVVAGIDSTGDTLYNFLMKSYFEVSQRGEKSTSNVLKKNQVAYLGIPIEVSFQKQMYGKIQFLALLGFRMQFLVYQNIGKIDDLTELKSSSKFFNYYGSFGIGYKINDQISLNAFLNMNVLNSGQLSINSSNSNTKIAYSPELRLTWNFSK